MSFLRYRMVLDYLFSQLPMYQRVGAPAFKKDLSNTIALLDGIGNPHRELTCVHVAGTNGKGSVVHLLAAGLIDDGKRVGIYTSPHYIEFRERIKIGPVLISTNDVVTFVNQYKPLLDKIQPSFFEMTLAMAFWYFHKEKVDIAIIETGLGGRLDSTNVVSPILSVITNIGYDHMDMLGYDLPAIAGEKAGIIKENVPVVIGSHNNETDPVFLVKASQMNSSIHFATDLVVPISLEEQQDGTYVQVQIGKESFQFKTDLTGPYQGENIVTALAALKSLHQHNYLAKPVSKLNLSNIRISTSFMGRWQVVQQNPLIICDSAHNVDGLKSLFEHPIFHKGQDLHIVFGVVSDKRLDLCYPYLPKDALWYFAKANVPRGMPAIQLRTQMTIAGFHGNSYQSVRQALRIAIKRASRSAIILVTGSIFVVAEVLEKYAQGKK